MKTTSPGKDKEGRGRGGRGGRGAGVSSFPAPCVFSNKCLENSWEEEDVDEDDDVEEMIKRRKMSGFDACLLSHVCLMCRLCAFLHVCVYTSVCTRGWMHTPYNSS